MAPGVEEHAHAVVALLERWRQPQDWHERAACRGLGPAMFYPPITATAPTPEAVACCARCPVRGPCAEAGRRERAGIWGGRLHRVTKAQPARTPLSKVTARYERRDNPSRASRGAA